MVFACHEIMAIIFVNFAYYFRLVKFLEPNFKLKRHKLIFEQFCTGESLDLDAKW